MSWSRIRFYTNSDLSHPCKFLFCSYANLHLESIDYKIGFHDLIADFCTFVKHARSLVIASNFYGTFYVHVAI